MLKPNVPAWFEIPVSNLDRAQQFYEDLLDVELRRELVGDTAQAIFPYGGPPHASGALVRWNHDHAPARDAGTIVYLSVADIRPLLVRASERDIEILQPPTPVPGTPVVFTHLRDSEGNRVGFASVDGVRA